MNINRNNSIEIDVNINQSNDGVQFRNIDKK